MPDPDSLLPVVQRHRLLGRLAVIHAALVIGFLVLPATTLSPEWVLRLWLGFVTLWALWPIVLLLHPGRSTFRLVVPLSIALLFLAPATSFYCSIGAPLFGLPRGVSLWPPEIFDYLAGYRSGQSDAQRDVHDGRLLIEVFLDVEVASKAVLQDRYDIRVRRIAGDAPDDRTYGHARGYNSVSLPEIERRFGKGILDSAGAAIYEALP